MGRVFRPMVVAIRYRVLAIVLLLAVIVSASGKYLSHYTVAVLQPRGQIGLQERHLIEIAVYLSLLIVIPVFGLLAWISWTYRAGNKKATYTPNVDGNRYLETIWWLIPSALILVLSVVTWNYTHKLDPFKAIASDVQPLNVQVVALDWKWLFIYPSEHIATVNYVQFPVNRPVNFQITADAPMNSFWIPQLGGQIYAMPGMLTQLHLNATSRGDYRGSSANISGVGFAGMKFTARASTTDEYTAWVRSVQQSPKKLTTSSYAALAEPSSYNPVISYSQTDSALYNSIIDKYMTPGLDKQVAND